MMFQRASISNAKRCVFFLVGQKNLSSNKGVQWQSVFGFVPLARARREITAMNHQAGFIRKFPQEKISKSHLHAERDAPSKCRRFPTRADPEVKRCAEQPRHMVAKRKHRHALDSIPRSPPNADIDVRSVRSATWQISVQ